MSAAKFTPGPWDWFTELNQDLEHNKRPLRNACMRFLVGSGGQGFAHTVGLNHETDEANARLIAAAPELLEALQMLYDETADYIRLNNLGGMDNQCMQLARAALAKAIGSAP